VSTEAHACPHCGALVRAAKSSSGVSGWIELKNAQLWFIVLMVAIVAIWGLEIAKPPSTPSETSTAQSNIVGPAYKVIEQWSIPNGGFGRVIVVAPSPGEADLRALGEKLRQDTRNERNAVVFVYDDSRAAEYRRAAISEKLPKAELQHHDRHRVAMYLRNVNTGFHELDITPEGLGGPNAKVKY